MPSDTYHAGTYSKYYPKIIGSCIFFLNFNYQIDLNNKMNYTESLPLILHILHPIHLRFLTNNSGSVEAKYLLFIFRTHGGRGC